MSEKKSQKEKLDILRMSNEESNKLTKECIETALIDLLQTQEFDKISISDIVKRAGVSRMAYYRNYESKEDILSDMINKLWDAIAKASTPMPDLSETDARIKLFDVIKEYKDMYKVILKAGKQDIILQRLNESLINLFPDRSVKNKYFSYLTIGMLYNVMTEWIKSDFEISSEELVEIVAEFSKLG